MSINEMIEKPIRLLRYLTLYTVLLVMYALSNVALKPLINQLSKLSYNSLPFMFTGVTIGVFWGILLALLTAYYLTQEKDPLKPKHRHKKIEYKYIAMIAGITILSIIVFAATTDFNVKVFYDIGYSLYIGPNERAFVNKLGILPLHIAACFFIAFVIFLADRISVYFDNKIVCYVIFSVLLMTFGIFDAIRFHAYYGGIKYFLTYSLFYISFGFIFHISRKSRYITTLLIVLIYFI